MQFLDEDSMNKLILAAAFFSLAGCVQAPYQAADPVASQCEYEAEIAIQHFPNPLYAGFRKGELIGMCLRAKGR